MTKFKVDNNTRIDNLTRRGAKIVTCNPRDLPSRIVMGKYLHKNLEPETMYIVPINHDEAMKCVSMLLIADLMGDMC